MSSKIPRCPADVTKEWLQEVIKSSEKSISNNVEVIEISQVEEKLGFLSGIFKAKINVNCENQNLFIKCMLDHDDPYRYCYDDNR